MKRMTPRQEADAIEQFGDDLMKLCKTFCDGFSLSTVDLVNGVPDQEKLETIARAFQLMGQRMNSDCDEYEEAEDRRPKWPRQAVR